jgi:hypothetical protein
VIDRRDLFGGQEIAAVAPYERGDRVEAVSPGLAVDEQHAVNAQSSALIRETQGHRPGTRVQQTEGAH